MTCADEGQGREPELTQAKAIRDELHVYAAQLRKMETQAGMGGRDLAVRVKEPDWLIRLMIRAASALEVRDRCGLAARAAQAEASASALRERVDAALTDACRMSAILLMAGEMTAQERRTARAVADGIASKIRTALEAPHAEI